MRYLTIAEVLTSPSARAKGDRIPSRRSMLTRYVQNALKRARYELIEDEPRFYGEIPDCPGVFATGETLESCREELAEVLEEWVLFRVSRNLALPVLDGIELRIREVA